MDIKEKAIEFALKVPRGYTDEKLYEEELIHLLSVAKILENFGYGKDMVVAGCLHDVIKDTKYSNNFTKQRIIYKLNEEFGSDIYSLVSGISKPSKSMSWEEKSKYTFTEVRNMPLEKKLIIAADKINNLEKLYLTFEKKGKRSYSWLKDEDSNQRWYYTNLYESLVDDGTKDLPIFKRLKTMIDKTYPDTIKVAKDEKEAHIRKLHAQISEIGRLKSLKKLERPFIVEFLGTPHSFENENLHKLQNLLSVYGLKVVLLENNTNFFIDEPSSKNILSIEEIIKRKLNFYYHRLLTATITCNRNADIILAERSITDTILKNYITYKKDNMTIINYLNSIPEYKEITKYVIDLLNISYRDIPNLEDDSYTKAYNDTLFELGYCSDFANKSQYVNTTSMDSDSFALKTAENITNEMSKKYRKTISNHYNSY